MTTEWTLASEQEEYISEAIERTDIGYVANAHIVGLIERGSYGILSILDEICSASNYHHHAIMSQLYGSNLGAGGGSGSSTPSLASGALSTADEAFLDRLIERFGAGQNPFVEIAGGRVPTSSSGAPTVSTGSAAGQELDMDMPPPAGCMPDTEQQKAEELEQCSGSNNSSVQQKNETNEQDKCLSQYCFRYYLLLHIQKLTTYF